MAIVPYIIKAIFALIAKLFFKELTVLGVENVPKNGPVIICGNHANQYVDAMLMFLCSPRIVSFIIAASSYNTRVVGTFARLIKAIPVQRPQDIAKKGIGTISEVAGDKIIGRSTKFMEQVKVGDSIRIKNIPGDRTVKSIVSDTELIVKSEPSAVYSGLSSEFKILPKLDHTQLYDKVWERLHHNACVGIFPEGGSHDRTQMLPLKAGVCIMALGTMSKYNTPVTIVPCGFNYFKGYRFRSEVVVEFGTPYVIPQEFAKLYQTNKKEAIGKLLKKVEQLMNEVVMCAPSYAELMAIYFARKLYVPDSYTLTRAEEYLLNHRLAVGYSKLKDHPEVKKLFKEITNYQQDLRKFKIDDSEIKTLSSNRLKNVWKVVISLIILALNLIISLPGLIFNGPVGLLIQFLSERQRRRALARSEVKIKGTDVLASNKLVFSIVAFPVLWIFWTIVCRTVLLYYGFAKGFWLNVWTMVYFIGWPFYCFVMIKSIDTMAIQFQNVKARFILLLFKSKVLQLRETRKRLKNEIKNFVETHAGAVTIQDLASTENDFVRSRMDTSVVDEKIEEAFESLAGVF